MGENSLTPFLEVPATLQEKIDKCTAVGNKETKLMYACLHKCVRLTPSCRLRYTYLTPVDIKHSVAPMLLDPHCVVDNLKCVVVCLCEKDSLSLLYSLCINQIGVPELCKVLLVDPKLKIIR